LKWELEAAGLRLDHSLEYAKTGIWNIALISGLKNRGAGEKAGRLPPFFGGSWSPFKAGLGRRRTNIRLSAAFGKIKLGKSKFDFTGTVKLGEDSFL